MRTRATFIAAAIASFLLWAPRFPTVHLFATGLAWDNSTESSSTVGTSLTFSHTVGSGAGRVLFVCAGGDTAGGDASGTHFAGVTYPVGGVATALTQIDKSQAGSRWSYLYYLANPDSGAHNVVLSSNGTSIYLRGSAHSYSGADTTQPDQHSTPTTTSGTTSFSAALTTVVDQAWMIWCVKTNGSAGPLAGSGITERTNDADGWFFGDSNAAIAAGTNYSVTVNNTAARWATELADIKPPGSSSPKPPCPLSFFGLLCNETAVALGPLPHP